MQNLLRSVAARASASSGATTAQRAAGVEASDIAELAKAFAKARKKRSPDSDSDGEVIRQFYWAVQEYKLKTYGSDRVASEIMDAWIEYKSAA